MINMATSYIWLSCTQCSKCLNIIIVPPGVSLPLSRAQEKQCLTMQTSCSLNTDGLYTTRAHDVQQLVHTHFFLTHQRCPTAAASPPSCDPSWAPWGRSRPRWWRGNAGRTPGARSAWWWTFCRRLDHRWPGLWAGARAASRLPPVQRVRALLLLLLQRFGTVRSPIMGSAWESCKTQRVWPTTANI